MTLNYHHLRYFWLVAREGSLTRCARKLRVSPSALSAQIRQLEEQLGAALFARENRSLVLTESGRLALAHANDIFTAGDELLSLFREGKSKEATLTIGAEATLSRNFQESFVKPLLQDSNVRLRLIAAGRDELLSHLKNHALDLVLTNRQAPREAGGPWRSRRIARQPVGLVGRPRMKRFRLPRDLDGCRMILPSASSDIRAAFDDFCTQQNVRITVFAEVDDMATMRLLARDADAVALVPPVVVRDELLDGVLQEYGLVPGLFENFYAITIARRFEHPLLRALLARDEADVLDMGR